MLPTSKNKLPRPNPEQIAISEQLTQLLAQQVFAHQGFLPFDQFMNLALYHPQWGYYCNAFNPFSSLAPDGDFVTAPMLSPLFGHCIAKQAIEVFERTGVCHVLEIGAGNGQLASDLLLYFQQHQIQVHYQILELSASLQQRQRDRIQKTLEQEQLPTEPSAQGLQSVEWLTELPQNFTGLILGNELLDAMPVKIMASHMGIWHEQGVTWDKDLGLSLTHQPYDQSLYTAELPPIPPEQLQHIHTEHPIYITETHHQQKAFIDSLTNCIGSGAGAGSAVILMIDYGFSAQEYYHPERHMGTLMCHIQHVAHDQPLYFPGVQDLTAHVNFSALVPDRDSPKSLQAIGYVSQANFLINLGVLDELQQAMQTLGQMDYLSLVNRTHKLMSEAEMGELFKVMAWSVNLTFDEDDCLMGFERGDRLHTL